MVECKKIVYVPMTVIVTVTRLTCQAHAYFLHHVKQDD